jgi:hypothetical protein
MEKRMTTMVDDGGLVVDTDSKWNRAFTRLCFGIGSMLKDHTADRRAEINRIYLQVNRFANEARRTTLWRA